ncbi:MAG: hypothetical protein ACRD1G_15880, partial [Acidimicrobiales bacterium]
PGLIVATGHYRNGILLAPVTAYEVARILLGGTAPEADRPVDIDATGLTTAFGPFRPERFAAPRGRHGGQRAGAGLAAVGERPPVRG